MTGSIHITVREAKALLDLSESVGDPSRMSLSEEELAMLEAKLRADPREEDIITERMAEAATVCHKRWQDGSPYQVCMDIVELGVRVTAMNVEIYGHKRVLICPWTEITMCVINPLLRTIDRALKELAA